MNAQGGRCAQALAELPLQEGLVLDGDCEAMVDPGVPITTC